MFSGSIAWFAVNDEFKVNEESNLSKQRYNCIAKMNQVKTEQKRVHWLDWMNDHGVTSTKIGHRSGKTSSKLLKERRTREVDEKQNSQPDHKHVKNSSYTHQ